MGGIAGIIYSDVLEMKKAMQAMLDSIAHRGLSHSQIYSHQNVQLGTCGQQLRQHGSIVVTIDGTFYNKPELIQELKTLHYPLKIEDEGEILACLYNRFGKSCFEKLNGDFAAAIFDKSKGLLFLARDCIGKKPLYWFHDHNHFIFGSELKSLLATGFIPQTPDKEAISTYLALGYIPQDMSPIAQVNKLLPGYILQYDLKTCLSVRQYWSFSSFFTPTALAPTQIESKLHELLQTAIQHRIPAENIIGWLQSSVFEKILQENSSEKKLLPIKVDHETSKIDDLIKINWHLDEPSADPSVIKTWNASKMTAQQQSNTLFSDLGSHPFLSEHSRELTEQLPRSSFPYSFARRILIPLLQYLYPKSALSFMKKVRKRSIHAEFFKSQLIFEGSEMYDIAPDLTPFDPDLYTAKFYNLSRITDPLSSHLYLEVKTHLADNNLLQCDRLGAAHSINWETPVLDKNLLEFYASLPKTSSMKVPDSKINDFPLNCSSLFPLLSKGILCQTGLIAKDWIVQHTKNDHIMRASKRKLWTILALEIWYRLFIHSPIVSRPPDTNPTQFLMD